MLTLQESLKSRPKSRVELHVHLFSAIRSETLWEVSRQKDLPLPGGGSLLDLKTAMQVQEPTDLVHFLKSLGRINLAVSGDLPLMERVAYELVEDQARESVAYCEVRFTPQSFLPRREPLAAPLNGKVDGESKDEVTVDDILKAVLKGLSRGEEEFGTKMRVILSCVRKHPEWSWEVLRLCQEYRDAGVVGIDVCGPDGEMEEGELTLRNPVLLAVYKEAKEKGIHRTIHAGESAPASAVTLAVEVFDAERIGHGYTVVEDEAAYQMCLSKDIHFEICPHSSYLTGAIQSLATKSKRHPLLRLAEDQASFSINTDDPIVTNTRLSDEYQLITRWGLTEAHIARANFQAALRSFLPDEEKMELLAQLREAYGVADHPHPSPRIVLPPPKGELASS